MINIKESRELMKTAGLSEDKLDEYEKIITPFFDFSNFISNKLGISKDEAEKKFNTFTKKYMIEKTSNESIFSNLSDEDEIQNKIFEITGEAAEQYALENDYDSEKSKELKDNLKKLMNFMLENFNIK